MVVDPRHDHSMRIPRPDLSVELGTPNACNQCHTDKPSQWAVHKSGAKRATKLCDSEEEAKAYIEAQGGKDKLEIQFRPGERTRCEGNYCSVAEFCEQFKGWKNND